MRQLMKKRENLARLRRAIVDVDDRKDVIVEAES
jgi:hypothetical protein